MQAKVAHTVQSLQDLKDPDNDNESGGMSPQERETLVQTNAMVQAFSLKLDDLTQTLLSLKTGQTSLQNDQRQQINNSTDLSLQKQVSNKNLPQI